MRRILLSLAALLAWCSIAHAQICNPPSGWLLQNGQATIGDNVIFGPTCGELQDGGLVVPPPIQSITTNHPIVISDCQTALAVNGALTTITFPNPAGFPACQLTVMNVTAGRAILIAGSISIPPLLFQGQSFTAKVVSGAWVVIDPPGRFRPAANVNLYVLSSGNDANDGQANTASAAFATCNGAINSIAQYYDFKNGIIVTINDLVVGQTTGCSINGPWPGAASLTGLGSPVVIDCNSSGTFSMASTAGAISVVQRGIVQLQNCTINIPSGGTGLFVDWQGQLILNGTNTLIGSSALEGAHVSALSYLNGIAGAILNVQGSYTFNGLSGVLDAYNNAVMAFEGSSIVITGNISYGQFTLAQGGGIGFYGGTTITNPMSFTTTGTRFLVENGGHLQTQLTNNNLTYFPGSLAGSILSGGFYDTLQPPIPNLTASLSGDVALNNVAIYRAGPTVAQGTSGTWFASGKVTLTDTAGAATFGCKLWDGTTIIDSAITTITAANLLATISLSGTLASPAASILISCIDITSINGAIKFNASGGGKDSTITALQTN